MKTQQTMPSRTNSSALLVGMMATFVGIGVSRFAYSPIMPALITQHWLSVDQAAYLGAANLLGYLFGAASAHKLSEHFSPRMVIRVSYLCVALSFILCGTQISYEWLVSWRFIAGFCGAALMVVAPSLALANTSTDQKTIIGALFFSGIGVGALLSATVVPILLHAGLSLVWLALGGLVIIAALLSELRFSDLNLPKQTNHDTHTVSHIGEKNKQKWGIFLVLLAYALDGAGFVPHTVFWVDYLAREIGLGQNIASMQWAALGLGAVFGPFIVGHMANRIGWHSTLLIAFMAKGVAIALPVFSSSFICLLLSSLIVGAMIPGIVALTAGRLSEMLKAENHKQMWGTATAMFAAAQAIAGYSFSALYSSLDTYVPLFEVGAFMLFLGGGILWGSHVWQQARLQAKTSQ